MDQHQQEWAPDQGPVLNAREFALFSQLTSRLPARWLATRRNRRLLFLALAAPGFFAVFGTIYHHTFWVMVAGFFLFGAAVLFRSRTEPLFERAVAADLWPSPEVASAPEDTSHA